MVRGEILEQILNRVVTKATAPVSHIMGMRQRQYSDNTDASDQFWVATRFWERHAWCITKSISN